MLRICSVVCGANNTNSNETVTYFYHCSPCCS